VSKALEIFPGMRCLSLSECVEEFSNMMLMQLDLRKEAESLTRLRRNFHCQSILSPHEDDSKEKKIHIFGRHSSSANMYLNNINFPEPLLDLCSESVLIETFQEGKLMIDMMNETDDIKHQLAILGLHAILKMVFEDNFVHAGN
jgi:aarF domain-containing kinase